MPQIPAGWEETTLGEIADITMGQSPKWETYNDKGDGIPFYQWITEFWEKFVRIKTYSSQPIKIVEPNTILFSVRAPVWKINITKHKACIGRWNAWLFMKNKEQEFLFYLLKYLEKQFLNRSSGTVFDSINRTEIENLPIHLPPLPEQQAIAAVLSSFDDKIELLRAENQTLEQMGQELFKERFGKWKVGDVLPEGWRVGKLGEIADLLNGFSYKSSDFVENGKYRLVTIANVQDWNFIEKTKDSLDIIPEKMPDHCLLKTGDILLSLTWNVGRVCLVIGENYFLNQRVAKIFPKNPIDYAYSYLYFRQKHMITLLESISVGTAQQNLSPIKTSDLSIIVPLREILDSFWEKANILVKKIIKNLEQIQTLSATRDQLLPKLMSGEVRVKF